MREVAESNCMGRRTGIGFEVRFTPNERASDRRILDPPNRRTAAYVNRTCGGVRGADPRGSSVSRSGGLGGGA